PPAPFCARKEPGMLSSRGLWYALLGLPAVALVMPTEAAQKDDPADLEVLLPNDALRRPFAEEVPMAFVSRGLNKAEWEKLPRFFNEVTEPAFNPAAGK